jgi:hypothetical protein
LPKTFFGTDSDDKIFNTTAHFKELEKEIAANDNKGNTKGY